MIKKVGEFEFPRVLDEIRPMRRRVGGANWSKRVNLASKRTRVENDMEPLRILFFSNNLVSTAMTLVSTMKVNVFTTYQSLILSPKWRSCLQHTEQSYFQRCLYEYRTFNGTNYDR